MHASLQCSVKQHHAAPERDGLQGRGWSVRVYSGLMLAKVRPTGTNAHTHFKSKRSEWNVTKCCLEVAAHTIGGFTVHIMFPFTASFCKAASIEPCGPCQSSHSKKRGHRSARCTGKSLDRAEKHRSSGGRWNNLGTKAWEKHGG